jgi:hypothetical protein
MKKVKAKEKGVGVLCKERNKKKLIVEKRRKKG